MHDPPKDCCSKRSERHAWVRLIDEGTRGLLRRKEPCGVVQTLLHQSLAEDAVTVLVARVMKHGLDWMKRLRDTDLLRTALGIFEQEDVTKPRAKRPEGSLLVGTPDINRIPDRLFRPVIGVVTE